MERNSSITSSGGGRRGWVGGETLWKFTIYRTVTRLEIKLAFDLDGWAREELVCVWWGGGLTHITEIYDLFYSSET